MEKEVTVFKSEIFQQQVNNLSFKENNFAFKKCRTLVEMLKAGNTISHLEKIENQNIELPLYAMKTQKQWRVLLTLEPNNELIFLRLVAVEDIESAIASLNLEAISEYDFKEFWQ